MCHKVSELLGTLPNILVRIWGWGGEWVGTDENSGSFRSIDILLILLNVLLLTETIKLEKVIFQVIFLTQRHHLVLSIFCDPKGGDVYFSLPHPGGKIGITVNTLIEAPFQFNISKILQFISAMQREK